MNHEQVLGLITTRETATAAEAEQLRAQIAALAEQLAVLDTELADLKTTRTTLACGRGPRPRPPPSYRLSRPRG